LEAREPGTGPRYRLSAEKVGDADPYSGVSVTPRFAVAPLFPIQNFPWTWIYVVYVEKAYKTKMRQVLDSQSIVKEVQKGSLSTNVVRYASLGFVDNRPKVDLQEVTNIMWALYGDEPIVDRLDQELYERDSLRTGPAHRPQRELRSAAVNLSDGPGIPA
jgi:hypothetical protein